MPPAARHVTVDRRVLRIGNPTGDLTDPLDVSRLRDEKLPPTAFAEPTVAVLDLNGKLFSPSSLRELIVPLGQRIRGGVYGNLRIVVVTADYATREFLDLLARHHEIPLYVAPSTEVSDVSRAEPLGCLTSGSAETLRELVGAGWNVTASSFAKLVGIEPTAATNRLVNLEREGYLYRIRRHRNEGDLFVDPRAPRTVALGVDRDVAPRTAALAAAGIHSNPYDTSTVTLQGDAAARAAEILRRRGKAT